MNMELIQQLQEIINKSGKIVFFGGAGVSTESGIPDFRSTSGLYKQEWDYPPETIISHSFFMDNTSEFYRFYRTKMICLDAKPNKAHLKLAEMEQEGKLLAVVTQNIDGLHQLAGSKNIFELHGSVHRNYCQKCNEFYDATYIAKTSIKQPVPTCTKCDGVIKPDVVLYEEGLDDNIVNGAVSAISQADTLIIGGTSLIVYPAASLIRYFHGKNLVLINKSETKADDMAQLVIHDSIGEVLDKIIV